MVLKPAIFADIAFIHVHEADVFGNARLRGTQISDIDVANSAKRVVITAERLIPHDEMTRSPETISIPFYLVDAVCEVPYGAYPVAMPYEYYSDEEHLKEWLTVEQNPEVYNAFVQTYVYGCRNHQEYVEKRGGTTRMQELRRIEFNLDLEARPEKRHG